MELETVMRTTFAAREFLDEPVSDEQLFRILDNARFAPSGGNRQGWRVIVVKDADKRSKLRELIVPTFKRYIAQVKIGESPWNTIVPSQVTAEQSEAARLPAGFVEGITEAPVVLLVFVDLRVVASMDQYLERIGVISGASIYPFAWNILLAARAVQVHVVLGLEVVGHFDLLVGEDRVLHHVLKFDFFGIPKDVVDPLLLQSGRFLLQVGDEDHVRG